MSLYENRTPLRERSVARLPSLTSEQKPKKMENRQLMNKMLTVSPSKEINPNVSIDH